MDKNVDTHTATESQRSTWQLWLLVAIFFGPLLVAAYLYFGTDFRPEGRSNYGVLNEPARPLPEQLALTGVDAAEIDREFFEQDWMMLQFLPTPCGEACKQELYRTRQTWLGLDRRRVRVRRVAVVAAPEFNRLQTQAAGSDPNLILLKPSRAHALAEFFGVQHPQPGVVYLVDPVGNWVITWPEGYESTGIQADMRKLLKLSKIG